MKDHTDNDSVSASTASLKAAFSNVVFTPSPSNTSGVLGALLADMSDLDSGAVHAGGLTVTGAQRDVWQGSDGWMQIADGDTVVLSASETSEGVRVEIDGHGLDLAGAATQSLAGLADLVSTVVQLLTTAPETQARTALLDRLAEAGTAGLSLSDLDTESQAALGPQNATTAVITGTGADEVLEGTAAAEFIDARAGNDTVTGAGGDDEIDGGGGADTLFGQEGNDQIIGGFANDQLFGGSGNDTLFGGDGNDSLYGDNGADQMDGGNNSDFYVVDQFDTVTDTGEAGYDKVQIGSAEGRSIDMDGWSGIERANGNVGDDVIDASTQTDAMLLFGDDGDDTLIGGTGNDAIIGGDGDDAISGGAGDDVLLGADGDDTYTGGAGSDTMYIGEDGDRIIDAGEGNDKAVIYNADGIVLSVGDWLNVERINGFTGDDTIDATGMETRVVLVGKDGNDTLTGGLASDTFYAGKGDDRLSGGAGNDALIGGDGDDTIFGGAGNDFYFGGGGADTYGFADGFGKDVIKDFVDGVDRLNFATHSAAGSFADLVVQQQGAHTVVRVGDDFAHRVTIANYTASNLNADDVVFNAVASGPATITFALSNDTGTSNSDNVSSDAALSGTVSMPSEDMPVLVSINGGDFFETSATVDSDGNFALSQDDMDAAGGGTLAQGNLRIQLAIANEDGVESASDSVLITYDTTAAGLSSFGLATSSDTGAIGDGETGLRAVKITGEGEAGATVSDGTVSTVVGQNGSFALSGVAVALGSNEITLTTTDKAGNATTNTLEVTGVETSASDTPVLIWNEIALESVISNAAGGTTSSRALAMQSIAVFDVIAAIDGSQAFLVDEDATEGASMAAAIASASHAVLKYAFPGFGDDLDAYLAASLAAIDDGDGEDAGVALGVDIAAQVIEIRGQDGWDDFETYAASDEVGEWRETGPFYNPADNPQYATMDTWTLDTQDQFRTDGPAALTSEEYAEALNEVKEIGEQTSATRTDDQTEAARFWLDGAGSETTPGHWNSIATDYLTDQGLGAAENAKVLAALNLAVADAMIAAWDAKYTFGFWRPSDAIKNADEDGNADTLVQAGWTPLLVSPSHPEYVSGHGAASGAAAEVLTSLLGENAFETSSVGLDGVTRSFDSYWEAAEENANSRLWAGVHFDFSNMDGLEMGQDVAQWALAAFNTSIDGTAPKISLDASAGYYSSQPVLVTGSAIDSLSGLAALSVTVNGGTAKDVGFDENGDFSYSITGEADGTFTLQFTATDGAGNVSGAVTSVVVIDTAAPTLALTSTDEDGGLSGATARLTGAIDGTGAPIIALAYQINEGAVRSLAFDEDTGAFDAALNLSAVGKGEHTVNVVAVDAAGNSLDFDVSLTLDEDLPFQVTAFLPAEGAAEVGSTFRPEVHFSHAVDIDTLTEDSFYAVDASGDKLPATILVGPSGLKAWLFFEDPMPGASTIEVVLEADQVMSAGGASLDGDGDNAAGGDFASSFTTVSTTIAANTKIVGHLYDPGADLKPMTVDDFSAGEDGSPLTDDDVFFNPIVGAEVWILGLEGVKITTDENGYFELDEVPAGNVKLAIDGRTATNSPDGVFWPEMVMDMTVTAGQVNTMGSSMGTTEERLDRAGRTEVYLPRVDTAILQTLSEDEATEIGTTAEAAQDLTQEQREAIKLVVQPGTTFDENGDPVEGASVGISTVPPELVMDMLPAGLMQHTFDLTIQAPDAAVFTEPAELTLPNVFNADPGTKLNILSFDHTTGRLVIEGTATVSADGKTVTTDPDTGITKPGWHGMTPPGNPECLDLGNPDGDPDGPDGPLDNPPDEDWDGIGFGLSLAATGLGIAAAIFGGIPLAVGAAVVTVGSIGYDVYNDSAPSADLNGAMTGANGLSAVGGAVIESGTVSKIASSTGRLSKALPFVGAFTGGWDLGSRVAKCASGATSPVFGEFDILDGLPEDSIFGLDAWMTAVLEEYDAAAAQTTDAFHALISDALDDLVPASVRDGLLDNYFAVINEDQDVQFVERGTGDILEDPTTGENLRVSMQDISDLMDFDIAANVDLFIAYTDAAESYAQAMEYMAMVFDNGEEWYGILEEAIEGFIDTHGLHSQSPGSMYYVVTNLVTGEEVARGISDDGLLDVFLGAETHYEFALFDPERDAFAKHVVYSGPSGSNQIDLFGMGGATYLPVFQFTGDELDSDGDLLPDLAEEVIGTDPFSADTDGDMLSDYLEVTEGLDPLGGFPTSTGVIASLELSGAVIDIHVAKNPGDLDGNYALVLTSVGLSVIDISAPRMPLLTAEAEFSDMTPARCAYDESQDLMAVLGTDGEVRLFDLSDPTDPVEIDSVLDDVDEIAFVDGYLVVTVAGRLRTIEPTTGEELDSAQLGAASEINGLTSVGNQLYAMGNTGELYVVNMLNGALFVEGSVSVGLSNRDRDLFAADDVVYVPASNGFSGGYATVDVSDPSNPTLSSPVDNNSIGGTSIALNGTGRGVIVGNPGGAFGVNVIDVIDTSQPSLTGELVTRYEIDATPTAVAIAAGLGYVGDAGGNFHAVNYQSFDTGGVAPVVTFDGSSIDQDPDTDGVQLLEGSLLNLSAVVTDDVGIRELSLLIDGDEVAVDLSYPFDLFAEIPVLLGTEDSRNIEIQMRAVDTGGNIGLSDVVEVEIVPDTIAPMLASSTVEEGALYGRSKRSFTFNFDEPLDADTVTEDTFVLTGPDGVVTPISIDTRGRDQSVIVSFEELSQADYTFTLVGTEITDVAGNAYGTEDATINFSLGTFSNEWQGADGATDWNDAANWTADRVPDATDDVYIGIAGNQTINLPFSAGDITLETLILEETLVVRSGTTLTIEGEADLNHVIVQGGTLVLNGAATVKTLELQSGTVSGEGDITVTESLDWDTGTLNGTGVLTVDNGATAEFGRDVDPETGSVSLGYLYLQQEMVLKGSAIVGGAYMSMGSYFYDADLGEYVAVLGTLEIAEGAELDLSSYRSDMYLGWNSEVNTSGLINNGTLRKSGGGTSTVVFADDRLGNVVTEDGSIGIGSGSTLVIDETDDFGGLAKISLDGGILDIAGDAELAELRMNSGTLTGEGNLTITDMLEWYGGVMQQGGDVIIAEDATAQLGTEYDVETGYYYSYTNLQLYRDMVVQGTVEHDQARVYLGTRVYNAETAEYDVFPGRILVEDTGVYVMDGPSGAMYINYASDSGLTNDGVLRKTGGGTSGVALVGDHSGDFEAVDGLFELSAGTFTLTQALVDAGLSQLAVVGGTLIIEDGVSMDLLKITSGTVKSDGDVEVNDLNWIGGTIDVDGTLSVPDGGTANVGYQYDGTYVSQPTLYLFGDLEIEGTLDFNSANMRLGTYYYDYDVAAYVTKSGNLTIADGGAATFDSYGADMTVSNSEDGIPSGLINNGTLTKAGGGSSAIPVLAGSTGDFVIEDGTIVFSSGVAFVTAEMVAAGLSDIKITGGRVVIDDDVTLNSLYIDGGVLDGAGDVTVVGSLTFEDGAVFGDGSLVLEDGAEGQFGLSALSSLSARYLYLAKDVQIDGDLKMGTTYVYLGDQDNWTSGDSTYQAGTLTVGATGSMDFQSGTAQVIVDESAISNSDTPDAPRGIVNEGTIVRTATTGIIQLALAENTGVLDSGESAGFYLNNNAVFTFDGDTSSDTFDAMIVNGGQVNIDADVDVADFSMLSGTLDGDSDLTVTNSLNWSDGSWAVGGSVTIADGATAIMGLGHDPENPTTRSQIELMRELIIEGDATLERGLLRMGDFYYDSDLATYVNTPGTLSIAPGGVLTLEASTADITGRFTTSSGLSNTNLIDNEGTLAKSGGGTSSLQSVLTQGDGAYIADDGFLEILAGTTLVIDDASSLSGVRLAGGIIQVDGDVSIADLQVFSGQLLGDGDLTITDSFIFEGGIVSGAGDMTVALGATALFGQTFDGLGTPTTLRPELGRDLTILGDAVLEQVDLRMGANLSDDETGTMTIGATGTLELSGPNSDFTNWRTNGVDNNALINNGIINKTGGGTSVLADDIDFTNTGTVNASDGLFSTESADFGSYDVPAGPPTYDDDYTTGSTEITASDGLDEISVNGGTVVIDEDITLTNLSMINGRIEGSGTITVTGEFYWEGGRIGGGGALEVEGTGIIGGLINVDAYTNHGDLYLGKELVIDGDTTLAQARIRLGEGGTAGIVTIDSGATLTMDGYLADIYRNSDATDGTVSEVVINGTLEKSGGGVSVLQNMVVSGEGAITLSDGVLSIASGATLMLTADLDMTGISSIQINGGTVTVQDDVSVAGIEMLNGTLNGAGDLTITDTFVFSGGTIVGEGALILPDGSTSVLGDGIDLENPNTASTIYLGKQVDVSGDMTVARGYVYLGNRIYDAEDAEYDFFPGTLDVSSTGSLTLWGERSDLDAWYDGELVESGVNLDGALIKSFGGDSFLPLLSMGSDATVDIQDGALRLLDGSFTLTQAMVDAGLTSLTVHSGAELIVEEDVSLPSLILVSGAVDGAGDLTITESFEGYGTIRGEGTFILDDAAEGTITNNTYLQRNMDVAGDLEINANLYLGNYFYNPDTEANEYTDGLLTILDGGRTELGAAGAVRYYYTNDAYGVSNLGTFATNALSNNYVVLTGAQTGTFEIGDAPLVLSSGTLTLTQDMVDAGLDNILITSSAQLIVSEAVTLPNLVMQGGSIAGLGELTIGEAFKLTGGALHDGGNLVIADGATAQFGNDFNPDSPTSSSSAYLYRTIEVDGAVEHNGMLLYMGRNVYNSETASYDEEPGRIDVNASGTYTLRGPAADLDVRYSSESAVSGLFNDGTVAKVEGGASTLPLIGGDGTFEIISGELVLSDGTVQLTQALIDAGLTTFVVEGGTLEIGEALTVADIDVRSGSLILNEDVTVTDSMTWTGGTIETRTSVLTVGEDAEAVFGIPWDVETVGSTSTLYLRGDIDIAGTVMLESAQVRLGQRTYDGDIGDYVFVGGTMDVLSGGELVMNGPKSGLIDTTYHFGDSDAPVVGVNNAGTLTKTGGGESEMILYGTHTGSFDQSSGRFSISNLAERGDVEDGGEVGIEADTLDMTGVFVLTDDMVANGLNDVLFTSGIVQVDDDVALETLELRGGTLLGDGDLDITDNFVWTGGVMTGDGDTAIAEGATALMGAETNEDTSVSEAYLSLGRDLIIDGDAQLEQARITLGDDFDFVEDGVSAGVITVSDTGALTFYGPKSDLYEDRPTDDDVSGISSTGTLIKAGGGITNIEETLEFLNTGTFDLVAGAFDAPGDDNDFGL